MRVAIVIPALNEAENIGTVIRRVSSYGVPIVVDDGSADATGAVSRAAGAIVVRHDSNKGYDGALASGFKKARAMDFDAVVTFDADGQLDHNAIPDAIERLCDEGVRLVLGTRSRAARFAERLFNLYSRLRFSVPDILCGLKAFDMTALRAHSNFVGRGDVNTGLALALLRQGEGFALVDVRVQARQAGTSRFGSSWRANRRILLALIRALVQDVTRWNRRG